MNAVDIMDEKKYTYRQDRDVATYMERNTGTNRGMSNYEQKEEETQGPGKGYLYVGNPQNTPLG